MRNGNSNLQTMLFDEFHAVEEIGLTEYFSDCLDDLIGEIPPSIFEGSPFEPLITLGSARRGMVGEKFISRYAAKIGMFVEKTKRGEDADRWINGKLAEIKTARESESYTFVVNQIRPQQEFEYVVILAIKPNLATLFTIPKAYVVDLCQGQHGGKDAQETAMYTAKSFRQLTEDFRGFEGTAYFREVFRVKY